LHDTDLGTGLTAGWGTPTPTISVDDPNITLGTPTHADDHQVNVPYTVGPDAPTDPNHYHLTLQTRAGTNNPPFAFAVQPGFKAKVTPAVNWTGRQTTQFGLGEVINMSFTSSKTASDFGGLQWTIVTGGGSLASGPNGNSGLDTYTAPCTPGSVKLRLQVASGSAKGKGQDIVVKIIAPSGVHLTIPSSIFHTSGQFSNRV
jgi:hypothetical protein